MNFDSVPRLSYRIDILFTYFLFSARWTFCLPFDDEIEGDDERPYQTTLKMRWNLISYRMDSLFAHRYQKLAISQQLNTFTILDGRKLRTVAVSFFIIITICLSRPSRFIDPRHENSRLLISTGVNTRGGRFSFVLCTNKIKWKVNGSTSSVPTRIWPSLTNVWSHKGKIIRSIPIMSGVIILTCIVVRLNERVKHV